MQLEREVHGARDVQPLLRAHERDRRKAQPAQLLAEVLLILLRRHRASLVVRRVLGDVPLVDDDHHGLERIHDHLAQLLIDLRDLRRRVDHEHNHIATLDRTLRAVEGVVLDLILEALLAAQPRRVDRHDGALTHLDLHIHRVSRGARDLRNDHTRFTRQRVHKRALARVPLAHDRELHIHLGLGLVVVLRGDGVELVEELASEVLGRRRHHHGHAKAQSAQLVGVGLPARVVHLGRDDMDRGLVPVVVTLAQLLLAEHLRNRLVLRCDARLRVHGEEDQVRVGHRLRDLALDVARERREVRADLVVALAVRDIDAVPARIHDLGLAIGPVHVRVGQRDDRADAIARDTRGGVNDRDPLVRDQIEQRALAHIGAPDDGNAWDGHSRESYARSPKIKPLSRQTPGVSGVTHAIEAHPPAQGAIRQPGPPPHPAAIRRA